MPKSKRYFICFIGIDGSGKTTQAKLLSNSLKGDFSKVVYQWCRWSPFLLKPLIKFWKRKRRGGCDQIERDKQKILQQPLIKTVWVGFMLFDYAIQVFFKITLRLIGTKAIVISDRYFYDTLVDQAINFNLDKERIVKYIKSPVLRAIFPKPDLTIYFDCPAEIALMRKPDDLSVKALSERRKVFLKICQEEQWAKVDGALSLDNVKNKIEDIVREKLKAGNEEK